jgi:excisionase family DNA binding protein
MEKVIILKMDEVDLTNIIRQVIREEIKLLVEGLDKQEAEDILLSRKEAAKLLQISLVTINKYQKIGRLKYYKLGRKVFFKKYEIMKAIELPTFTRRYKI